MKKRRPEIPWLLNRFLNSLLPENTLKNLNGDFEEIYNQIVGAEGRFKANLWLWGQLLKSIKGFASFSLRWRLSMLKNYFKIAFRNITREKTFSIINILGLSIAIATCVFIYLFVKHDLSFNRFFKNSDSIYSIIQSDRYYNINSRFLNVGMAPMLKESFPEIDRAVRFTWFRAVVRNKNIIFRERIEFTDPEFFKVFSFKLRYGNRETVLDNENSIVFFISVL